MGSRLTRAKGERLSSQNAVAGLTESSRVTRSVWFPACIKALRVAQSTPMDGSPAPCSPAVVEPSDGWMQRSEEHTSELQSRLHLVCRLLLEKKNKGLAHIVLFLSL